MTIKKFLQRWVLTVIVIAMGTTSLFISAKGGIPFSFGWTTFVPTILSFFAGIIFVFAAI